MSLFETSQLATGYWLLVIGYWLLATGDWRLATVYLAIDTRMATTRVSVLSAFLAVTSIR
jgi:hypothetical protein